MSIAMNVAALGLPVLDLAQFRAGGAQRDSFLRDLRRAAREVGFFYLVGHGVDPALETQVVAESRRFFALPDADKLAVEMIHSPHFRGYTRAGRELTRGRPDWREQFDIHAEREALPRTADTPAWARLQGPNQWPGAQPSLRPALLAWQAALTGVAITLVRAFAEALEQPAEALAPIYADKPNQAMKIIRYPGRAAGEDDQGVGPHKDSGLITPPAAGRSRWAAGAGAGWLDRRHAAARQLCRQHRRASGTRLQRLSARDRAPGDQSAWGEGPDVDRAVPRRPSRRGGSAPRPAAASRRRGDRPHRRTRRIR